MKNRSAKNRVASVIAGVFVLSFAVVLALVSSDALGGAPTSEAGSGAITKAPSVASTVSDVLTWAETAKSRWSSIKVSGEVGLPGDAVPFVVEVSPEGYRVVEGETVLAASSGMHWYDVPSKKEATKWSDSSTDAETRQDLDQRMTQYAASDPAVMRPGELTIEGPLNDIVNPAYWVRKELRFTAQAVNLIGLETVSGRSAFHLRATFPPGLAKEESWDVFIDQATGIILKFVINPLSGEEGYEQVVQSVSINPELEAGTFDFEPPAGVEIKSPAGQER